MRVAEIKTFLAQFFTSVEVIGNEAIEIERVAKIENAGHGEISFVANPKYEKYLSETNASAVILSSAIAHSSPKANQAFIVMDDAYTGFVFVLEKLMPKREGLEAGIHSTAVVQSALPESASVGANAYVGKNCTIGERVQIYPNVVIMDESTIDDDCIIYPNTTIYTGTKIGKRVVVHSGCVIGADGFGFAPQRDGSYKKIPQIGIVVIEDDVEIGANTCIDRATLGETRIEQGVKLDNLIQIAHNVVIGKHTVIAAQAGISGSTKIGQQCMIAGQVGFVGHIEIGNKITIGAQSGIAKSFLKEGDFLRGTPARPLREQLRQEAYQANLKDLFEQVKQLEKALNELKRGSETALQRDEQ
ncbi:MAG: UDP-3-O-(3-hydroxymyristoyl)glucosamine N-acyltransferase [Chlorobiales bacterium]